jgi:DNA-binding SARP family transcriptional activator/tetratricopeptide (TPR) repeat protein/DNA polymerase III delta prime subunit
MGVRDELEFGVLGPVEGRLDGAPLDLGPRKQRLVLAALLLEPNKTLSTARLIDLTWPDSPPPTARTAIQGRISRLRTALAAAGADRVALVSAGSGYTLRIDPGAVDAHRFTALLARARAARTDQLAASLYDEALRLWRGPALDGVASEDVHRELCGNLEEARLQAVDESADARLRLGMHRDLVEHLTSHFVVHPTRERTAGQLALALYRCGRAGDALEVCRRTRQRLHDDLGVDPGPGLVALEVAILRKDESLALPAGSGVVAAHLPAAPIGFTGRAVEMRRLTELLADAGSAAMPVAVLSGPAGVGKTALAIHCAHELADRYHDGQLHVDLRGYDLGDPMPPVDALTLFLRALGLPPAQVPADLEGAVLAYRSLLAGRRLLVVLDNAGSAEQVRPLLPGAPGCAVLVTSRDDLRGLSALEGAWPLRLDVLAPAESLALLGRMVGADRLDAEPDAAAELARLCDHLPLALRIAGAHLAARPGWLIADYTRELAEGDRLHALAIPEDPRAAVKTAFTLSYRALAPRTRLLFRRLGLVPGPDFTAVVAASLCGWPVDDAATELDRLTTAHLVREHGPGRHQCHDLLRLYAADRAEAEEPAIERESITSGLYATYLRYTDAAARALYPHRVRLPLPQPTTPSFATPADALAWLEAELPNLTAAVHAAFRGGHQRLACLLADALRGYFPGRGLTSQWLDLANTALAAATDVDDPAAMASAHLSFGEAYLSLTRYPLAIEHDAAARDWARRADWAEGESSALGNLGVVHREAGDLRRAADCYSAALEINVRLGSTRKQVLDMMNLGVVHAALGRLASARGLFERATALSGEAGSPSLTGMLAQCLGITRRYLGELADAEHQLTAALTVFREINDAWAQASVLESLAGIHADAGRRGQARHAAEEALRLARDVGSGRVEAAALNTLGLVQPDPTGALDCHGEALAVAVAAGHVAARIEALIGQASAHVRLGAHALAERAAGEALAFARDSDHRLLEGQARTALAAAARDPAVAAAHAEDALAVHRETGYLLGAARTLRLLGAARLATHGTADPYWPEALALFTKIGTAEADDLRRSSR